MDRQPNIFVRETTEHGPLALLPKTVRLLSGTLLKPRKTPRLSANSRF